MRLWPKIALVALAAMAVVVYRHLRRRPPSSGTAALSR